MVRIILVVAILFPFICFAQSPPIEIGKSVNGVYLISADSSILFKAIRQTLKDGSVMTEMHIESKNKWHYLVASGTQKNYTKTIAVEIRYEPNNQTFYAIDGLAHKTCASAGCNDCELFKENGNIIGCLCEASGTVSNGCNFKVEPKSIFYYQLKHFLSLKK
jgi:hypothetical protein